MRRWILAAMVLLIASGLFPGAMIASGEAMTRYNVRNRYEVGDLVSFQLPDQGEDMLEYAFTPSANGIYGIYVFPVSNDGTVRTELYEGEEMIASGEGAGAPISLRLNAGTEYQVRFYGEGSAMMEIARQTLSRCYDQPLELTEKGYSKMITRAGDVHWYAVEVRDRASMFTALTQKRGIGLQLWLFDETGHCVAVSDSVGDDCVVSAELTPGQRVFLRVTSKNNTTGKYVLTPTFSGKTQRAQEVTLSRTDLILHGRQTQQISAAVGPADACELIAFCSSDPSVALVYADGSVEGISAGSAVITAYAYGGQQASCAVEVLYEPVKGVNIEEEALTLRVGDQYRLTCGLIPDNASDQGIRYSSENGDVVSVDGRGTLTATGKGKVRVVAVSDDGSFTDVVFVTVEPAPKRYRALLVGEQNYASTVDELRPGSIRSVESVESLLKTASFGGEGYRVTTLLDQSRDEVIAGIRECFADARESDVSLLYITCHGFYRAGMTFFVMSDGSVLSAGDLERELRKIPGDVVLLADCCGSGGLLGEASSAEDILDGVTGVFRGMVGGPSFRGSKVRVIASALLDQDSYRISFSGEESDMATVFARALCEAAGWSMDRDAQSAMKADVNYDGEVTMQELSSYIARRVRWYLGLAGDYVQNVQSYPDGDSFVVFARD